MGARRLTVAVDGPLRVELGLKMGILFISVA